MRDRGREEAAKYNVVVVKFITRALITMTDTLSCKCCYSELSLRRFLAELFFLVASYYL